MNTSKKTLRTRKILVTYEEKTINNFFTYKSMT